MSLHVGLTGGIGSGKSTFAKAFEALGVPIFYADREARTLYQDDNFLNRVQELMPEPMITPDGKPDFAKLASLIFQSPKLKQKLEALVHPAVSERYQLWAATLTEAPVLIREAAILFESGSYKSCDFVIMVSAPDLVRIRRVMERDGISEEQVLRRMQNQWPESRKMELADFCWYNLNLDQYSEAAQICLNWLMHRARNYNGI